MCNLHLYFIELIDANRLSTNKADFNNVETKVSGLNLVYYGYCEYFCL
jgi:hypothetical protein